MKIQDRLEGLTHSSQRKLTLFACSCVREIWHLLTDENKRTIETAEAFMEGLASKKEMSKVATAAWASISMFVGSPDWTGYCAVSMTANIANIPDYLSDISYAIFASYWCVEDVSVSNKEKMIFKQQQLFDDVFGE